MGGVHRQIEAFPAEQAGHVLPIQAGGGDRKGFRLLQEGLPVLRGHTGGDPDPLGAEEADQLPPLRGAREYADLIHPGILWG